MPDFEIIGDKVEVTKGEVRKELFDIDMQYDQDLLDIANIDREILEYQTRIDDALLRKANRLERIAVLEPLAIVIKEEKEKDKEDKKNIENSNPVNLKIKND